MKRLIVSGSICALWLLASCSPGEGDRESCTSSYVGSYEGTTSTGENVSGRLIGTFDGANGRLEVLTGPEQPVDYVDGDADVDEAGNLTPFNPASVRFINDGTFDLEACTASGTWSQGTQASGTWRLELPDTAF